MIKTIREKYNAGFTQEKYAAFLNEFDQMFSKKVEFRIAETPVFVDKKLKQKLIDAGEQILKCVLTENYLKQSDKGIPHNLFAPNEPHRPQVLAVDFAVCKDDKGEFTPQLIELQAFPSLFFWQDILAKQYKKYFSVPDGFSQLMSGLTDETYWQLMKKTLLGNHHPDNVILLEIEPDKQKTWIDFYGTRLMTGIEPVCISRVTLRDKKLYYLKNGKETQVKRIYNRVIFDELLQRNDLQRQFNLTEDTDVEWVGHPNWFFRVSKYAMPFIKSEYAPPSYFLSQIKTYPDDLENYVLKPLFSFAGSGVVIDVKREILDAIGDKENYILQKKVEYAPAFESPTGPVKVEIRLLYVWREEDAMPTPVITMGRLSKGAMIGVSHNKNKDWVGGSSALLEG
ncbi:MAG TPA: hypothetical protein PKN75_11890 [Bacteroidia bacterium]|nr:hypothetical protein [Bacteroidia bacterium]HNU34279.1 hypothetical protein [Bacteroidia bacterium]